LARWAEGKNKGFSRIGRGMGTHLGNKGGREGEGGTPCGLKWQGLRRRVLDNQLGCGKKHKWAGAPHLLGLKEKFVESNFGQQLYQ